MGSLCFDAVRQRQTSRKPRGMSLICWLGNKWTRLNADIHFVCIFHSLGWIFKNFELLINPLWWLFCFKKNLPDSLPINEEHKKKSLQWISCFLSSFFLTNLQFLHFPEEYFFLIICRLTTFLDYTRMLAYLAFFGYIHQEIEASLSTAITGKIKNTCCLTKHILYSASEKY